MAKRAFDKIAAGLRDAIAGRITRGTVYRDGKAIQRYTECENCTGYTLTVAGRCKTCGTRKIVPIETASHV